MPTFRNDEKLGTKVPLIQTDDLADKCVTAEKLAEGSVDAVKIADGSITSDKIAAGSVTVEKLVDTVATEELSNAEIDAMFA